VSVTVRKHKSMSTIRRRGYWPLVARHTCSGLAKQEKARVVFESERRSPTVKNQVARSSRSRTEINSVPRLHTRPSLSPVLLSHPSPILLSPLSPRLPVPSTPDREEKGHEPAQPAAVAHGRHHTERRARGGPHRWRRHMGRPAPATAAHMAIPRRWVSAATPPSGSR
jgi:hypothetical protein